MIKKNELYDIIDTYEHDYDIHHIDSLILSKLKWEKVSVSKLTQQLNKLENEHKKRLSFNAKKKISDDIVLLKEKINIIDTNQKLNAYESVSKPLLEKYDALKNNQELDKLEKVVDAYISVAKNYISMQITKIHQYKENVCTDCGYQLKDVKVNIENTIRCPACKTDHQVIMNKKPSYDSNIQNACDGNDMNNFIKTLTRYEGLQAPLPAILYEKLDIYFKERGMPTSAEIKALPYNEQGKKGNTNRETLCTALSNIGYSEYYEDFNLIGKVYWDWKLPNLFKIRHLIIEHYKITQKCYYKIPIDIRDRISSLGTQYRLWRHLQLLGHECYMDDFKIAENSNSLQNQHRLWKLMCDYANHEDIYYID